MLDFFLRQRSEHCSVPICFFNPPTPSLGQNPTCSATRVNRPAKSFRAPANDMPYTPYTDATLNRLAELNPQTLAIMHGSTFRGNGREQILGLASALKELIGPNQT